jgi:hypothetical protein
LTERSSSRAKAFVSREAKTRRSKVASPAALKIQLLVNNYRLIEEIAIKSLSLFCLIID